MTSKTDDEIDAATLKRLREPQARVAERDEKEGRATGVIWAKQDTEADELKRVAAITPTS